MKLFCLCILHNVHLLKTIRALSVRISRVLDYLILYYVLCRNSRSNSNDASFESDGIMLVYALPRCFECAIKLCELFQNMLVVVIISIKLNFTLFCHYFIVFQIILILSTIDQKQIKRNFLLYILLIEFQSELSEIQPKYATNHTGMAVSFLNAVF